MKKILVVDDSSEVRSFMGMVLESAGHETYQASSGKEALQLLRQNKVDLIISDLEMDEGSGRWLLDQLQTIDGPPKIIILSGDVMASEDALKAAGAMAFFPKPLSLPTFLSYLSSHFNNSINI